MANELLSPIIDAMARTQQANEFQQSREDRQKQLDAQMKEHQDQLKQQHDLEQQRIELERQKQDVEQSHYKLQAQDAVRQLYQSGALQSQGQSIPSQVPDANIPQQVAPQNDPFSMLKGQVQAAQSPQNTVSYGGQSLQVGPGSGITSPEELNTAIEAHARALNAPRMDIEREKEVATAALKKQIADAQTARDADKFDNLVTITKMKGDFADKLAGTNNTSKEGIAARHDETMKSIANIRATQAGVDPDLAQSRATGAKLGLFKLGNDKVDKVASQIIVDTGSKEFDPKDAATLRSIAPMEGWLETLKKAANFLPSEAGAKGKFGARVSAMVQGAVNKSVNYPSDIKQALAKMKANVVPVAKAIEGLSGRPTIMQMNQTIDSMLNSGITKEQALDRINQLQELTRSAIHDKLMGGMSDEQQNDILKKHTNVPTIDEGTWKRYAAKHNITVEQAKKDHGVQ